MPSRLISRTLKKPLRDRLSDVPSPFNAISDAISGSHHTLNNINEDSERDCGEERSRRESLRDEMEDGDTVGTNLSISVGIQKTESDLSLRMRELQTSLGNRRQSRRTSFHKGFTSGSPDIAKIGALG